MHNEIQILKSKELEDLFLISCMYRNTFIDDNKEVLLPVHFSDSHHSKIFKAMLELREKELVVEPLTLKKFFEVHPDGEQINSIIDKWISEMPPMNCESYPKLIYEYYLRRQLVNFSQDLIGSACDSKTIGTTEEIIYDYGRKLDKINQFGQTEDVVTAEDIVKEKYDNLIKYSNSEVNSDLVKTYIPDLDDFIGGLSKSDLIILAARPSMGKTALACNIGFNVAKETLKMEKENEGGVLFFSLEMSNAQLATRLISSETGVSANRIMTGNVTEEELKKIESLADLFGNLPLHIYSKGNMNLGNIRKIAKRYKKEKDIDLIIIDYLQLIRIDGKNLENRVLEISEISRSLKALAKELDIPIIALSQLSRAVETRDNKRPLLADLRESGSIEQDADLVVFIFREEYYLERAVPNEDNAQAYTQWRNRLNNCAGKAEILISKFRQGNCGNVKLNFDAERTTFY